ncbi:MAG: metallophosphoesterase family protein [Paracoccaceae bacterium]|nr:metallophosphoesterase family protein [Paracoccaceae bacterium]
MKIAVISDIHSNIDALDAVLSDIARQDVDQVVNLGDCLSGPFDAAATAGRLMALDMPTVSGNHDRALWDGPKEDMGLWESWVIDDLSPVHLDWLKSLPDTLSLGEVFLCHATPDSDQENWLDYRGPQDRLIARDRAEVEARDGLAKAPVLLCGHTHSPRIVRLSGNRLVVNPGAVGCPAYLDTRMEPPFIHETGAPDARYAIVERRGADWQASLYAVPYDASRMAALARSKDSESWAQAIETGWITPAE